MSETPRQRRRNPPRLDKPPEQAAICLECPVPGDCNMNDPRCPFHRKSEIITADQRRKNTQRVRDWRARRKEQHEREPSTVPGS